VSDVQRWCLELADQLADVGRRLARLAEQVAVDWPDPSGSAWAERADQLQRELAREAVNAAELGRDYEPGVAHLGPDASVAAAGPGARLGVRLGGTAGHRVDDERGVRIAELSEPAAPPN
jgi:hypothetical protein